MITNNLLGGGKQGGYLQLIEPNIAISRHQRDIDFTIC